MLKYLPKHLIKLENHLKNRQWQEANEETYIVMLQVAEIKEGEMIWEDDIGKFTCEDLLAINDLWMKYSEGKFGFTVQRDVWLNCGGKIGEYEYESYKKFSEEVGWYEQDKDKCYRDLELSFETINRGFLPFLYAPYYPGHVIVALFSRIQACES